jgi:hypothetical protein
MGTLDYSIYLCGALRALKPLLSAELLLHITLNITTSEPVQITGRMGYSI